MFVLSYDLEEVRGLFCVNANARDFPVVGRFACAPHVRRPRVVDRAMEFIFLFLRKLVIAFYFKF